MATTYTLKSNSYDGRVLTLTCTQTANIANNTSTINWTLTSSGGNSNYYATGPTTVKINGTQVYYKARATVASQAFPAAKGSTSGSLTVTHATNGEKSVAVSLSTAIYTSTVSTQSGTWTLDSIGSASTASVSGAVINEWAECTISAASTSYTHEVYFVCLGETVTITSSAKGGTYPFSVPVSFYELFGTRESAVATGYCKTYSGSTLIGTTTFTFLITTGGSLSPEITSIEVRDTNETTFGLTGNRTTVVLNRSFLGYTIKAQSANEAIDISSIKVKNGVTENTHVFTEDDYVTVEGTIPGATSDLIDITVTDNRGNVAYRQYTMPNKVEYVPLTCNITSTPISTVGTMEFTVSGNWFNGSFGAVTNSIKVSYRYKKDDEAYTSWFTLNATYDGNTYSATRTLLNLDADANYTFQGQVEDKLEYQTSLEKPVQNKPIFDWSGSDFNFNVPVNFSAGATGLGDTSTGGTSGSITGDLNVSGGATITGDLRLKGSGNYGNTLYFGDGSYAYIKEATDDDLTIKANDITLSGNVYLGTSLIKGGTWTPELNSSAVSTYTVQEGWYQIVGDIASLGFLITATINSGYHSTGIEITGFPYDLAYRSSGGGTAFNVYCNSNFTFGSWFIDEQGVITPRMIPCNNTSSGNLTITSGCFYPSGGGSITLAGTICCSLSR